MPGFQVPVPERTGRVALLVSVGMLTGLAALLNAIRFADVDPKTGTGLELQAIAAAVVGGVAISGGRGNLWGVLAGVLLLACIAPALVFLRMPPQWEKAIQGAIILVAVVMYFVARSTRQRSGINVDYAFKEIPPE